MKNKLFILLVFVVCYTSAWAQVGINTDGSAPHASAVLDVKSTTQGMLVPRLTTAQRDAVSAPAQGLLVFDTDMNAFYFYDGNNWVNLSTDQLISSNATSVYLTDETVNFGVGTSSPDGKMIVQANADASLTDPVFEVRNKTGQTVFAVYNEGVRIYVDATSGKPSEKGGFAVGGFNSGAKGVLPYEFFRVTQDSVRVYIDENTAVAKPAEKGGFAVGGFNSGAKGGYSPYEFLRVTQDSVRVYINETTAKPAEKGGFAVGGYNPGKAGYSDNNYLFLSQDSSQVYVQDSLSGFEVVTEGNDNQSYFNITRHNCFVGYGSGRNTPIPDALMFTENPLPFNWVGVFNTFMGYETGRYNTTGRSNVFVGFMAGHNNIGAPTGSNMNDPVEKEKGSFNTFIGFQSGFNNLTGGSNVFMGFDAGKNNTTGNFNTFIGRSSGVNNTTGEHNITLGFESGHGLTTGSFNVYIGDNMARSNASGSHNVWIGEFIPDGEANNKLYINAYDDVASPLIEGDFSADYVKVNGAFTATTANITDAMRLIPRGTQPAGQAGMMYVDTNGDLWYYKSAVVGWKKVAMAP